MITLFDCIKAFVNEKFPKLQVRIFHDGTDAQIRIDDYYRALIAIYEDHPNAIFYTRGHNIHIPPPIGEFGPNDSWYIVRIPLEHPKYFDILSQVINIKLQQKKRERGLYGL